MDSYYAAANYLVGNREITYALVDTLIMKYRFQGGALTESAKLFETSLGMEDAAQRMRQNDPNELYPELTGFFYFYNINKSRGMLDSCKQMLQDYMEKDTSNIHRQLLTELYNRDFNNSAEHKDP